MLSKMDDYPIHQTSEPVAHTHDISGSWAWVLTFNETLPDTVRLSSSPPIVSFEGSVWTEARGDQAEFRGRFFEGTLAGDSSETVTIRIDSFPAWSIFFPGGTFLVDLRGDTLRLVATADDAWSHEFVRVSEEGA